MVADLFPPGELFFVFVFSFFPLLHKNTRKFHDHFMRKEITRFLLSVMVVNTYCLFRFCTKSVKSYSFHEDKFHTQFKLLPLGLDLFPTFPMFCFFHVLYHVEIQQ